MTGFAAGLGDYAVLDVTTDPDAIACACTDPECDGDCLESTQITVTVDARGTEALEALQRQVEELKDQAKDAADAQVAEIIAKLEALEDELGALAGQGEEALGLAQEKIEELLAQAREKVGELAYEIAYDQAYSQDAWDVAYAQAYDEAYEAFIASAKEGDFSALEADIAAAEAELELREEALAAAKAALETAQGLIAAWSDDRDALAAELESLTANLATIPETVTISNEQYTEVQGQLDAAKAALDDAESLFASLKEAYDKAVATYNSANGLAKIAAQVAMNLAKVALDNQTSIVNAARQGVDALQMQLDSIDPDSEIPNPAYAAAYALVEAAQEALDDAGDRAPAELVSALELAQAAVTEQEREVAMAQAGLAAAGAALESAIAKAQDDIEAAAAEYAGPVAESAADAAVTVPAIREATLAKEAALLAFDEAVGQLKEQVYALAGAVAAQAQAAVEELVAEVRSEADSLSAAIEAGIVEAINKASISVTAEIFIGGASKGKETKKLTVADLLDGESPFPYVIIVTAPKSVVEAGDFDVTAAVALSNPSIPKSVRVELPSIDGIDIPEIPSRITVPVPGGYEYSFEVKVPGEISSAYAKALALIKEYSGKTKTFSLDALGVESWTELSGTSTVAVTLCECEPEEDDEDPADPDDEDPADPDDEDPADPDDEDLSKPGEGDPADPVDVEDPTDPADLDPSDATDTGNTDTQADTASRNYGSGGSGGSSSSVVRGAKAVGAANVYAVGPQAGGGIWNLFDEDGHGWEFVATDGGKLVSTWAKLVYTYGDETITHTYHFDADGKMEHGWFLDGDGSWYYLSEEHDGWFGHMTTGWHLDPSDGHWYYLDPTTGVMATGWQLIDGQWYYFTEVATDVSWYQDEGGKWVYGTPTPHPIGSMYKGELTPDGHAVGPNGVWVP
ncbi:MAG: hypothetical protein LBR77_05525 [Lachnospiraceae bacterium]|jgi:hypothetical protein|nr:hypothetical protein [Lachnospiraceae bacterium]